MFDNPIPLLGIATLVALAGVILLRPLRRSLITRPIFSSYRKVLPQMSDTERDALEHELTQLREAKATMSEEEYYARLEAILLRLARLYRGSS